MKEELKNLRILTDLEEKLLAKLNENLRRVKDDGTVNMECEQVVILETFARINIVRQEIGSNFNYFHNKIINEDQRQQLNSFRNKIEKLERSLEAIHDDDKNNKIFFKNKISILPISDISPIKSNEIEQRRKLLQNMLLDSINEFNLTTAEKENWIKIIKKTQLYTNNISDFNKQLTKKETALQEQYNLEKDIKIELNKIVESKDPVQAKVKNILKTLERGNQEGFNKDYFLMTFLLSEAGKQVMADIHAAGFMSSMEMLNQITANRDDKEFFNKFIKNQNNSILKSLDATLNHVIEGKGADDKLLFARINRIYNFLTVIPEGIHGVELNNYLENKLGEIFVKAQAENISTEMQLDYLLKYRDKFKDLKMVKFDDQIQKIIEQKYDNYALDLNKDLKQIDENLKGERYTKYAEQINLIQRKIHNFESTFPDGQFKQKVAPIYELLNNELQRLTNESVEMIKKDNARSHIDKNNKDFYSLYSKIWNMNELSRKIDAKPPEEITQLCDRIKKTYLPEEIFKELNRFLRKDAKELTINGKLARLNLVLKYMNLQDHPEAIKITRELLQGTHHGISRIVNNPKNSAVIKLDKLDKYYLALKQAQISESTEQRLLLNKTEQQLRENLANDLTSLSRNLFKNFSPINYINDPSYKHEFLDYPIKLQEYVVDDICKRVDPEIRSLHMSRWISVGEMCIKNGDIATAMAIFSSLAEQNIQQNHIALNLLSDREKQLLLCVDDWAKYNNAGYMTMLEDPKYCDSVMKVPHPAIMGARLELAKQRGEQTIDTNIPTQLFKMLERYVESVQTTPPMTPQTNVLLNALNNTTYNSYVIERRVEKYEKGNEGYAKVREQNIQFNDKAKSANQKQKEQFIKNQALKTPSEVKEEKYNFNEVMQTFDHQIIALTNFQNNIELRSQLENLPQIAMLNDISALKPMKKIEPLDWNNFYQELGKVKNEIQNQWEAAKKEHAQQKGLLERNLERQRAGTLADAEAIIKNSRQELEKSEKRLTALKQKLDDLNSIPKEMPEKLNEVQFHILNQNFKCSGRLIEGEFIWGSKSEGLSFKRGDKSFDRFQDMFVYQNGQVLIRDLATQTTIAKELPKFKDDLYAQVVITLKEIKDMVNIDLRRELSKPEAMFDMSDLRHHHTEYIFSMINNRFNDLISNLEKNKNVDNEDRINHIINGLKQEQQKYVEMKQMVNNVLNAENVELKAQQLKKEVYVAQPIMNSAPDSKLEVKFATLPVQKYNPQPSISPDKSSAMTATLIKSKPEQESVSTKPGFWATITGGIFSKPPQKPQSSSTAAIFRTTASGNLDTLKSQFEQPSGKEKERLGNVDEYLYEINHFSQGKRVSTIAYAKNLSEIADQLGHTLASTDNKLILTIYCKDAHDKQCKGKLNLEFAVKGGNSFELNTTLQDISNNNLSLNTYKQLMSALPGKLKEKIVQDEPVKLEAVENNATVVQRDFSEVEKRAKATTEFATQTQNREISNTSMRFKNP